jgi:hypothetical protein
MIQPPEEQKAPDVELQEFPSFPIEYDIVPFNDKEQQPLQKLGKINLNEDFPGLL